MHSEAEDAFCYFFAFFGLSNRNFWALRVDYGDFVKNQQKIGERMRVFISKNGKKGN